jgi:crotonobetainyl-CoA:carnitine CoA-transferase CaiB-like acyl-CoA transferase
MPPAAHQAYAELQAEQAVLLAEATRFEEEGAELAAALAAAEGELSRNSLKQRALNVQVCLTGVHHVDAAVVSAHLSAKGR